MRIKKIVSLMICMFILCMTTYALPNDTIRVVNPQYKYVSEIHNGIVIINGENDRYLYDVVNDKKLFSSQTAEKLFDEFVVHTDYINMKCWLTDYKNNIVFEFPNNVMLDKYINDFYVVSNWETFKSGLMNKNGEYILECIYDHIHIGANNTIYLLSSKNTLLYNIDNKSVTPCDLNIVNVFNNMNHVKITDVNEKFGIANFTGKNITEIKYDSIKETFDEYYICNYDDKVDIINFNGDIVLTVDGFVEDIKDGIFFASLNNGITGYMNLNGELVIPLEDTYNGSVFQNGYAAVRDDYKYGGGASYIDGTGARATEKSWDMTYNFSNGYAFVMNKSIDDVSNKYIESWYIINNNFDVIKELDHSIYKSVFDTEYDIKPDFVRIKDSQTGRYGNIHIVNDTIPDEKSYNVIYQTNGGYGTPHQLYNIPTNSKVEVARCFYTLDGYTLSHWTDGTTAYYPGNTFIMPDHDVTLSAVWTENSVPVNVTGTIVSSDSDTTTEADDTVTITLTNADNTYNTTVVSSGVNKAVEYSIDGVIAGTYTMTVSKANHVTGKYTVIVGNGNVTQNVSIYLLGDANLDGKADSSDAVAILRKLAGYDVSKFNEKTADFNGDGKADSSDAVAILRKLAGY